MARVITKNLKSKRDKSQECQLVEVEVEVGTVALKQDKSASDALTEFVSNPSLNHESADVCAMRQMCV